MEWINEAGAWRLGMGLTVVGGVLIVGLLWWAMADLVLATFEPPRRGRFERWRERATTERKDRSGDDADAAVVA